MTDTVGCESSFTVEVPVLPNPVACFSLIPEAPSYLVGENIVFSNCSQYYNLCHWDFGDISESTVPSPSHTYAEIGTYDITLHVSDTTAGCDDTFEKTIIVHEKTRFYLPNSFTPNGDNVNDIFIPVQMEVKEDSYTMLIYDRYGMLVFKSTDLNRGWDGTVNGRLVPTGDTYVYRVSYQDFDGNVFEKNGKVTVVFYIIILFGRAGTAAENASVQLCTPPFLPSLCPCRDIVFMCSHQRATTNHHIFYRAFAPDGATQGRALTIGC